jgi:hypothetical protein
MTRQFRGESNASTRTETTIHQYSRKRFDSSASYSGQERIASSTSQKIETPQDLLEKLRSTATIKITSQNTMVDLPKSISSNEIYEKGLPETNHLGGIVDKGMLKPSKLGVKPRSDSIERNLSNINSTPSASFQQSSIHSSLSKQLGNDKSITTKQQSLSKQHIENLQIDTLKTSTKASSSPNSANTKTSNTDTPSPGKVESNWLAVKELKKPIQKTGTLVPRKNVTDKYGLEPIQDEKEQNPFIIPGQPHLVSCFPFEQQLFELDPGWDKLGIE